VGVGIESAPGAEPGPEQMKCGKCGTVHGIIEECPPPQEGDYPVVRVKVGEGVIKFKAHVHKVGTLGGAGGLRVSLDLDQAYIKEMAMLAECQHELIELEFEARQAES